MDWRHNLRRGNFIKKKDSSDLVKVDYVAPDGLYLTDLFENGEKNYKKDYKEVLEYYQPIEISNSILIDWTEMDFANIQYAIYKPLADLFVIEIKTKTISGMVKGEYKRLSFFHEFQNIIDSCSEKETNYETFIKEYSYILLCEAENRKADMP